MRIPYHNETYELHSFCDDEDEKYGNRYRCWTGEEVAQLKCRLCGIEFLPSSTSSSPLRVFQLPSGHFDDIVDDMICFEGPTAVPMTAREVAFARKGLLLMGDSFCLLHPSDTHVGMIDTTTVVKNVEEGEEEQSDEGPEREWHMDSIQKMARCGRCNYWLGDVIPTPYQEGSESAASTEIHAAEGGGGKKHCCTALNCRVYNNIIIHLENAHNQMAARPDDLLVVLRLSFALTSNSWSSVVQEEVRRCC